jgi:antitoxin ParD1/3/4
LTTVIRACQPNAIGCIVDRQNMSSSTTISVTLGPRLAGFVDEQIEQGGYDSASEVVRASLRLMAEREGRMEAVRQALIEGEQSGAATLFDVDAFIEAKRSSHTA